MYGYLLIDFQPCKKRLFFKPEFDYSLKIQVLINVPEHLLGFAGTYAKIVFYLFALHMKM